MTAGHDGSNGVRGNGPSAVESGPGARIHVVRFAPAKLNLTLAVVGRRDDGYHALHSVMIPLCLGDALTVSQAAPGAIQDSLRVTGLPLPTAPDNLVLRAIDATREAVAATWQGPGSEPPPLTARLAKRIPIAAGMGGGSSDAAAAIAAALAAWSAHIGAREIAAIAESLGSDVPFFLDGGAALVTGRGEFVESLPDLLGEQPAVLLVTPQLPMATAAVFRAYSRGAQQRHPTAARDISERLSAAMKTGLTGAGLVDIADELACANDLLPAAAALVPGLQGFLSALAHLVDRPVGQSGSGPTLWSLYPNLPEARKAVRLVRLAAANGSLELIGDGEPFVAATTIAGRPTLPETQPLARTGTLRPRTVHNWYETEESAAGRTSEETSESKGEDPR